MPSKIEIPDGSWHSTDDLTGKELEAIEAATGVPWLTFNPMRDITVYRAMVAAFSIRLLGMSDAEVIEWFNARTARQLVEGVKVDTEGDLPDTYEDGVPLAEGGPSTTSSASSPTPRGAGPQT